MTNSKEIKEHFEEEAIDYDALIPKLIPHYHEQNALIPKLLPFKPDAELSILDLGCGTGVLSLAVFKAFPNARILALDISENMLNECRQKLLPFKDRLVLKQGDFAHDDLGDEYDAIISGLSIHHLENERKRSLFRRIFEALKGEGVFINRDIVIGSTPFLTEFYHERWRKEMRENGEDDDKWFGRYLIEDLPAPVEDQLDWLRQDGFRDVDCYWRYLNFAIYGGRKT